MELFHEAENWLESLASEAKFFRDQEKPSLEPMQRALELFGHPDQTFDWRVVVTGTAGKGTVCRLTEDVLLRSGESLVTLHSPHVQAVTERIRINGKLIDPEFFGEVIAEVRQKLKGAGMKLTYYEALVMTGLVAGQKSGCKIFIGEIGLGGEWDAVNAVRGKRISALTFIGDDHRDILGPELEDIARTKAGIFTKDCVAGFTSEQNYRSVLREEADCPIEFVKGISQKLNKKLARKVVKVILGDKHEEFQKPTLPARWEKMPGEKEIILDGAHAQGRFADILPKIEKLEGRKIALIALAKNHDANHLKDFLSDFYEIIWTTVPGEREFWDPNELKQKFQTGKVCEDPQEALEYAKKRGENVIVTGSFYLCGILRENWYSKDQVIQQQTEFPV